MWCNVTDSRWPYLVILCYMDGETPMIDSNEAIAYLSSGMLTTLPSKKKKKLAVLAWLAEHIPPEKRFSEREFNELLNKLHTFNDPATLRRELYVHCLIDRSPDGTEYWLAPDRPSLAELLPKYCRGASRETHSEQSPSETEANTAAYTDRDLADAADFRSKIHAEALKRIQRIHPDISSVIDRYSAEDYFQQHWDYPGAWYTIVAIPESAGSREALIDTIVRDTLARYYKS